MSDKIFEIINLITERVYEHGGESYFVGGCVRDMLMGVASKDFDIEVHKISPQTLRMILKNITTYSEVGKSFGIFSLHGYPIDIALPRNDIQKGNGHRDFDISIDPYMGEYNAGKRRDFTINSIMQNIRTGEIIDNFNGIDDIKKKIIRHTNKNTFAQDPLRILRAAQFAARFNFKICEETVSLSQGVNLSALSKERVFEETRKALLTAEKPSVYFEYLKNMHQLSPWFTEIQFSDDVWGNAMKSLDNAALYKSYSDNPFAFMLCALSYHISNEEKRNEFVKTLTNDNIIINYVKNMSYSLLSGYTCIKEETDLFSTNKMFDEAIDKKGVIFLIKAIFCIDEEDELFINERLVHYYKTTENSSVSGKDLIEAGFLPGENFSQLLKDAHTMHLMGISKEDILLKLLK